MGSVAADTALYVPNEVLVKFKAGATDADIIGGIAAVSGLIVTHLGRTVSCADWATKIPANKSFLGDRNLFHIKVPASIGTEKAIAMLISNPYVEYAEKNYYVRASSVPLDSWFSRQWGLYNDGTNSGGTNDADIDAPEAWDICTGSSSVIIAILDSGIAYNHPDLQANIWTNSAEILDNVDNDGNGYIDDVRGWDFADNDNDPEVLVILMM